MKKQFTLLLVFLISSFALSAQIYVNASATGSNTGTSWTDAYTSLQSALADINASTEEIWVAAGTYKPTSTTDRTIYFDIPDGANVYGGFNGTETQLGERDALNNITTLSGDIVSGSADTYHVVYFEDVSASTLIDGFVITGGRADIGGGQFEEDNGGGIYIYALAANCYPQILNCTITVNHADHQGGGVFVHATNGFICGPLLNNCVIKTNTSTTYGGGVYVFGNAGEANPFIKDCIISGNSALNDGGGILTEGYDIGGICNSELVNCIISGNQADYGGGLTCWGSNSGENYTNVTNCTFSGNSGIVDGGAFENWTNDGEGSCNINIYNSIIWSNGSTMVNFDLTNPVFTYSFCDIEGSATWDNGIGIDGGNNIDANPYFNIAIIPSLTTAGDFHNHFASLAIGAGSLSYSPANDLDGNPFSNPPSMGAYEYTPLPGDWNGAINSDWGTAGNWLTGTVATSADDVYISTKSLNYPIVNEAGATPAECNNLELLASTTLAIEPLSGLTVNGDLVVNTLSTFTINSDVKDIGSLITLGTVSGNIETERFIGEEEWHLISTPVLDETANIFYGNYLQTYDETTMAWNEIVDESTILEPMAGYAMWGTTLPDTYYLFQGEPGNGNLSVLFTSANPNGWNLLGNPYPSSIDWDMVIIPVEMYGAVYYLDAFSGNYVSYNGGMGGGSQYVPPMQGFWVSANDAGSLSFGNSVRTHLGTDEYYKSTKQLSNYIALQVQSGVLVDKTYIRLNEEATPAFDGKYDAYKMMAPNKLCPQLYTLASDDKLSINQLPATDVIPVGFSVKNSGEYTISLEKMTDIQSCQLEDLKTGIVQDLEKASYTFNYTEGENANRFRLHLTAASVDFSGAEENIRMYAVGQEVFVKSANSIESGTVRITDLAGRTMMEEKISNESFIRLTTNLTTGVYIVSVSGTDEVRTEKVIIN